MYREELFFVLVSVIHILESWEIAHSQWKACSLYGMKIRQPKKLCSKRHITSHFSIFFPYEVLAGIILKPHFETKFMDLFSLFYSITDLLVQGYLWTYWLKKTRKRKKKQDIHL